VFLIYSSIRKNSFFRHPKYAFYYFLSIQSQLENKAKNAVVPILNNSNLKEITIKYPDLKTQQQIAQLLEQADLARQKRKAANALTDQFVQSSFLSMFGDPVSNEKAWKKIKVKDIGQVKTGNTPSRAIKEYYGPYISNG
jgi:type I restriction enzyme S subunit